MLLARLKPEKALEKLLVMAQEQKDMEAVSLFMDHLHKIRRSKGRCLSFESHS